MNFKRTSKFQRTNPEDYRSKLISTRQLTTAKINRPNKPNKYACELDEKGNKIRPIRDTWWLVESESSSKKTYLLQIHMKLLLNDYEHGKDNKGQIAIYGRIECDCKSFIYNDDTPRMCRHTLELSKRIYGEKSAQHQRLQLGTELDEPDVWCSHLAEMDTKIYNQEKAKIIEGKLKLRKDSRYARIPVEEQQRAREHYARMMGRNK